VTLIKRCKRRIKKNVSNSTLLNAHDWQSRKKLKTHQQVAEVITNKVSVEEAALLPINVFTALHGMQMQSSDVNSVCLSIRQMCGL